MATLQYEYSAPKLLLAEGSHCVEPGTYVVYDGAIVYKCVERVLAVRSRGKREVSSTIAVSTTATTEVQTTTGEETTTNSEIITELPTTTDAETTPEQSTTPGPESTTKLPTTTDAETTLEPTTTKSSPDSPSTKSPTTTNPKTTSEHETTTKSFPETEVKAEQFEITGAVVVKTQQPIFESQWNLLAAEIQAKLEKHRVLFTEDIRVELI
ncbi:hypothetical protein ANCCAN_19599 [Ancylostoma caninum]|uniref:Uncharacterized protein n=1 Tax=Ancylostoma caninum TaxID=29170 RepID=A0A368FQR6_ANCCA|nr:hypothetical protein ANCCAN_19599 [Ancylostoma caninum]